MWVFTAEDARLHEGRTLLQEKQTENLILRIGDDHVILSSEQKVRLAALITLGIVDEPISLDDCESHANNNTEIEMATHDPALPGGAMLNQSACLPQPGENSENVK